MARRPYRMTPKRKAALRKAQLASAKKRQKSGGTTSAKRRGGFSKRRAAAVVGGAVAIGAMAYGAHHMNGVAKKKHSANVRADARARVANRQAARASAAAQVHSAMSGFKHGNSVERRLTQMINDSLNRPSTKGEVRRQRARQKLATAAKGTSGSGTRVIVAQRHFVAPPAARQSTPSGNPLPKSARAIEKEKEALARHRMADKANRQRGLAGYIPGKAKHDRRRTKAQRKKYPRI